MKLSTIFGLFGIIWVATIPYIGLNFYLEYGSEIFISFLIGWIIASTVMVMIILFTLEKI